MRVLDERAPMHRRTRRRVKARPPGVLGEGGVMSDPAALAKLGDPQFRSALAQRLSQAILHFWEWRHAEQSALGPQPLQQP